jgi:hypothetical protein
MKVKIVVGIGMVIIVMVLVLVFQAGGHLPFLDQFLDDINPFKPKEQITINIVITDIKQVSQLVTTKYTIQQVDRRDGPTWRLIMIEKGTVEAGLDLKQITESNVTISEDNKSIIVNLPPVMILTERDHIVSDAPEDTYRYDYWNFIAWITGNDVQALMVSEADDRMLETACKDGILKDATEDAQAAIERFLRNTAPGYDITVVSAPVPTECTAK